jgi:polar amino acid transport system substrate-binding protein
LAGIRRYVPLFNHLNGEMGKVRRNLLALVAGAVVAGMVAMPAAAKPLINGIDAAFPPFAYVGKDGKAAGFDVDAVNWIAKKQGFEVQHQAVAWEGIIPSLLANKIDFICSGMTITKERAQRVNFTDPYWEHRNQFVAKKDSKLTIDDVYKKGVTVGVQQGTSEYKWLQEQAKEKGWNLKFRVYDSAPMAGEDVLNGRIEVAAMNDPPAKQLIAQKPLKSVGSFGDAEAFGCAVRKEDAELYKKLNEGYKLLRKDPYWNELLKKHNP